MPKWAVAIGGLIICSLCTLCTALLAHIFINLSNQVDHMSSEFGRLASQVTALQAQVDTQSRLCRFPNK